jgi:Tol biopolymer transport system component
VSALVAFSGTEGGSIHIWIGNMDDNTARQITHGEEKSVLPSWSPDGSHLAYYCCRNGSWELWITGQEDGAMRRLCAVQGEEGDEPERPPAWSDDGKRILFCEKQVSGMYLVSVDPDTGQRSYIIKSGELLSNPYIRAERAFFSKSFSDREEIICYDYRQGKSLRLSNSRISGSRLWFCMNDDMLIFTRNNDLWSMNRNGFNKKLLFSMEGEESYPAISPDGSMLAFVSVRGNNRDLYVYTLVTHQ